jgi:hypothetical protein
MGRKNQVALAWSFFLLLATYFPLLLADRYHVDDWGRSVLGYYNWKNPGRPFADSLMHAVDNGFPFTDCSPIPQLFALLFVALAAVFAGKRLGSGPAMVTGAAALALGANPFFLANLSFKFDSLPTSIGLLLAVCAALITDLFEQRPVIALIVGTAFLYATLCFYQPCLNAFFVLITFEIARGQKALISPGKLARLLVLELSQAFLALLIYGFVVAPHVKGEYSLEHSSLVSVNNFLPALWRNFTDFWSQVPEAAAGNLRLPLFAVPALAFILSFAIGVRYIAKYWKVSLASRLLSLGSLIALLAGFILAPPGVLILLESTSGGPRTYVGFSVLLFACACYLISILRTIKFSDSLIFCLTAISVFPIVIFAATYADATKTQKNYEAHIADLITADLLGLPEVDKSTHLTILGDVGYAPNIRHLYLKKYPFLSQLLPIDLKSDASGGFGNTVLRFRGVPSDKLPSDDKRKKLVDQLGPSNRVKTSPYYDIHVIDKNIVLQLKPIPAAE